MDSALDTAKRYAASGLSVLPVRADGTKAPALDEWALFAQRLPSEGELQRLFVGGVGVGVIGGAVSGGLEILDFDQPGAFEKWRNVVIGLSVDVNATIATLPLVRTPGGGEHLYYRCANPDGSAKLALAAETYTDHTGKEKSVIIETKGEGGYVLAPGSPAACHEAGACYELVSGSLAEIPRITDEQRDLFLKAARSLNEVPAKEDRNRGGANGSGRPGDKFNDDGPPWSAILEPHGWKLERERNGVSFWRRPGKRRGISATTGHCGDKLYVFSSNASPFDSDRSYDKFGAFVLLEHGGDLTAATRTLVTDGYGFDVQSPAPSPQPAALTNTPESDWDSPIPLLDQGLSVFPIDALPDTLREFCEAEAEATQTPVDLSALLTLAACGVACQRNVNVRIVHGWSEPLNIYVAAILPPASRKSQVFADVIAPLEAYEREEAERMRAPIVRAESDRRIIEAQLRKAETEAARANDREAREDAADLAIQLDECESITAPRIIADDVTPEMLVKLLNDHGGRMGVMSAEGGGPFAMMRGRYSKGGQPNFEVFLKAHAGDTLRVDRIGRPADHVENPALTLGFAIQPDVIRGLSDEPLFRGQGLLARFLFSMPRDRIGERNIGAQPVPGDVRKNYEAAIRRLISAPKETSLVLDSNARDQLMQFATWLEPRLGRGGDLHAIADWAGKLVGAVARIAGLLHAVEARDLRSDTLIASISNAVEIGMYLIGHARAVFGIMGSDSTTTDAQFLLDWMLATGQTVISKRETFIGTRTRFCEVKNMDPALERLTEHGYIRLEKRPEKRVGRPSVRYEINPGVVVNGC